MPMNSRLNNYLLLGATTILMGVSSASCHIGTITDHIQYQHGTIKTHVHQKQKRGPTEKHIALLLKF